MCTVAVDYEELLQRTAYTTVANSNIGDVLIDAIGYWKRSSLNIDYWVRRRCGIHYDITVIQDNICQSRITDEAQTTIASATTEGEICDWTTDEIVTAT